MNSVRHLLQHLVLGFAVLFLLTSLFAQEQRLSQIQPLTPERIVSQPGLNGELPRQLHWSQDIAAARYRDLVDRSSYRGAQPARFRRATGAGPERRQICLAIRRR